MCCNLKIKIQDTALSVCLCYVGCETWPRHTVEAVSEQKDVENVWKDVTRGEKITFDVLHNLYMYRK